MFKMLDRLFTGGFRTLWTLFKMAWPLWIWLLGPFMFNLIVPTPPFVSTERWSGTVANILAPSAFLLVVLGLMLVGRAGKISIRVCGGMQLIYSVNAIMGDWTRLNREAGEILLTTGTNVTFLAKLAYVDRYAWLAAAFGIAIGVAALTLSFMRAGSIARTIRDASRAVMAKLEQRYPWLNRKKGATTAAFDMADSAEQGSARLMTHEEAVREFPVAGGVPFGVAAIKDAEVATGQLLCDDASSHGLVVAPPKSGKTVCVALPILHEWTGPIVAFDLKPELCAYSARYRREKLGLPVYVIGPGYQRMNVLSPYDRNDPLLSEHCGAVARDLLPAQKGGGDNQFFIDAGHRMLTGLVINEIEDPANGTTPNLIPIRDIINASDDEVQLALIQICGKTNLQAHNFLKGFIGQESKTFSNTMATIRAASTWMSIPSMLDMVTGDDLDLSTFVADKATIYLAMPESTLQASPAVARVSISALLKAVYRHTDNIGGEPAYQTLFLVDEFPRLKKMDALIDAFATGRGKGVTIYAFLQTRFQAQDIYGEPGMKDLEEQAELKLLLRAGSRDTAEWGSKMTGETTILTDTTNDNAGGSSQATSAVAGGSSSSGTSVQTAQRFLLTADEVMRLPAHEMLAFKTGLPALRCAKAYYKARPDMAADYMPRKEGLDWVKATFGSAALLAAEAEIQAQTEADANRQAEEDAAREEAAAKMFPEECDASEIGTFFPQDILMGPADPSPEDPSGETATDGDSNSAPSDAEPFDMAAADLAVAAIAAAAAATPTNVTGDIYTTVKADEAAATLDDDLMALAGGLLLTDEPAEPAKEKADV